MAVHDLKEVTPEVRVVIEEYLASLESGMCQVDGDLVEDVLDETSAHLLDSLHPGSTPSDAAKLIADLGESDEYAANLCRELSGKADPRTEEQATGIAQPAARVLGMPADLKLPTGDALKSRTWNPDDPRIFTPRLVGIGWSINFAALAIRMGLMQPDDETEPFETVPEAWMWGMLMVPLSVSLLAVLMVALSWGTMPEELPTHWGISGQPDAFAAAGLTLWPMLAMILGSTIYAVWAYMVGKRKATRAVIVAFATTLSVVGASILGAALAWAHGIETGPWWPWVMIALAFGLPFAELILLSRIGRAEERRHDLGSNKSHSS